MTDPVRSALFVPANRRDWVEKSPGYRADAVVLDLEDATPPVEKEAARAVVAETVPLLAAAGQPAWVRVNGLDTEHARADVEAACRPGVAAVCLPKTRSPADVVELDRLLAHAEGRSGQELGATAIYPILETAAGLARAAEIFAASPRVRYAGAIAAPGADLEFELGYRVTETFEETLSLRSLTLLAARAAGVENPVTGLVTALDLETVRRFAAQSRSLGYAGMFVIHPTHVPVANEAFSPTEAEVAWGREVLETYGAALTAGRGATVDSAGRMVDFAMLRTAERVVRRHELFRERDAR